MKEEKNEKKKGCKSQHIPIMEYHNSTKKMQQNWFLSFFDNTMTGIDAKRNHAAILIVICCKMNLNNHKLKELHQTMQQ